MRETYSALAAVDPGHAVTMTIDEGTFTTTAEDALATLDALAPGETFHLTINL